MPGLLTNTVGAEYVIGYDAREMWLDRNVGWGDQWKVDALLQDDIDKPRSIDITVWSSVFDLLDIAVPAYTGLFPEIWENYEQLERTVVDSVQGDTRLCLLAFTVTGLDSTSEMRARWEPIIASACPWELDPRWNLLGYDVADGSGNSALVTMRIPADVPLLRERFGVFLNRAHLFDSPVTALEFRQYADGAIRVHAPFFVYGLWRVWEGQGSFPQASRRLLE